MTLNQNGPKILEKKIQILDEKILQKSGYRRVVKTLDGTQGGIGMKHTVYLKIFAFYQNI